MTPRTVCDDRPALTIQPLPYQELARSISGKNVSEEGRLPELYRHWFEREKENGGWLTIEDLIDVCRPSKGCYRRVELDSAVIENVRKSRQELMGYIESGKRIYGVNTGFGSARKHALKKEDMSRLSVNILYSHAVGVGRPLPVEVIRAMMLLRLRTFSLGVSGVREEVLFKLVEMLNAGVVPYVPCKGSVGCSGDLCSLAHLFLVMIGRGRAWVVRDWTGTEHWDEGLDRRQWEEASDLDAWRRDPYTLLNGAQAMEAAGLKPIDELQAKDGLALTNGATLSTAILALAVQDARTLYGSANVSASLTIQSVSGLTRAYEPWVQAFRPHAGQVRTGWEMLKLLKGSDLVNRSAFAGESQDDYCLRSVPQVHGASFDTIERAASVAEIEMNSATDNPLFFGRFLGRMKEKAFDFLHGLPEQLVEKTLATGHCSAANFHGQPVALALDQLKIALAELASIAERRIQLLLDSDHNRGLPANLTPGAQGLHSGYMLAQYTAAALVSENKVLCHPSSVDSIPTSANAEDHVSMAANAANHTRMVVQNVADVLAIEVLCGLQALDIRTSLAEEWIAHWKTAENAKRKLLKQRKLLTKPPFKNSESFVREMLDEKARILFPQRAEWESKEEQKAAREEKWPPPALSKAADRVLKWIRDDCKVPFILHDGCVGEQEKGSTLFQRDGQDGYASFAHLEPAELIRRVSRTIRSGKLVERAWDPIKKEKP